MFYFGLIDVIPQGYHRCQQDVIMLILYNYPPMLAEYGPFFFPEEKKYWHMGLIPEEE